MKQLADVRMQENVLVLSGDLCFANVMSVYEKSKFYLHEHITWIIDFSQLRSSDSAGLALTVEWMKLAKQMRKSIRFTHFSMDLMNLAKAAGIDSLFQSVVLSD